MDFLTAFQQHKRLIEESTAANIGQCNTVASAITTSNINTGECNILADVMTTTSSTKKEQFNVSGSRKRKSSNTKEQSSGMEAESNIKGHSNGPESEMRTSNTGEYIMLANSMTATSSTKKKQSSVFLSRKKKSSNTKGHSNKTASEMTTSNIIIGEYNILANAMVAGSSASGLYATSLKEAQFNLSVSDMRATSTEKEQSNAARSGIETTYSTGQQSNLNAIDLMATPSAKEYRSRIILSSITASDKKTTSTKEDKKGQSVSAVIGTTALSTKTGQSNETASDKKAKSSKKGQTNVAASGMAMNSNKKVHSIVTVSGMEASASSVGESNVMSDKKSTSTNKGQTNVAASGIAATSNNKSHSSVTASEIEANTSKVGKCNAKSNKKATSANKGQTEISIESTLAKIEIPNVTENGTKEVMSKIGQFNVIASDKKIYYITADDSHHSFNAVVIDNSDDVVNACNDIRECCKRYKVVGFDAEWKPNFRKEEARNRVALIQIAPPEGGTVYLFRTNIVDSIPSALKQILEDKDIVKVGVSPDQDRRNILQDFKIAVQSTLELRILYKCESGLAALSDNYLGLELDKDDWQSNWARETLTVSQICYAALDAYTAVELFKKWDLASKIPDWDTVRSSRPIHLLLDKKYEEYTRVLRKQTKTKRSEAKKEGKENKAAKKKIEHVAKKWTLDTVWMDKSYYDDAERQYYEKLVKLAVRTVPVKNLAETSIQGDLDDSQIESVDKEGDATAKEGNTEGCVNRDESVTEDHCLQGGANVLKQLPPAAVTLAEALGAFPEDSNNHDENAPEDRCLRGSDYVMERVTVSQPSTSSDALVESFLALPDSGDCDNQYENATDDHCLQGGANVLERASSPLTPAAAQAILTLPDPDDCDIRKENASEDDCLQGEANVLEGIISAQTQLPVALTFAEAILALPDPPEMVWQQRKEVKKRRRHQTGLPRVKIPNILFQLLENLNEVKERNRLPDVDHEYYRELADQYKKGLPKANYCKYFDSLIYMEYYEELKAVEELNEVPVTPTVDEKGDAILLDVAVRQMDDGTLELALQSKVSFTWSKYKVYGFVRAVRNNFLVVAPESRDRGWDQAFLTQCRTANKDITTKFLGSTFNTCVRLYSVKRISSDPSFSDILFPVESPKSAVVKNKKLTFFNKSIMRNKEQAGAVINIVNGTSKPAPYIIFGPPGTGKTTVLVEAILQLALPENKILVCSPSNTVCNYIARKCAEFLKTDISIRFLAKGYADEPAGIRSTKIVYETYDDIITISTLINSVHAIDLREGDVYTHVFIDEAGFALECDAVTAMLKLKEDGQLVLAGDPKQLAPVCRSSLAKSFGLNQSFLERLFDTSLIYQKTNGAFDSRYITMLRDNYRCHQQILSLPNRLFYDNMLRAKCSYDPLSGYCLQTGKLSGGASLIIHSITGLEQQSGHSTSYYNEEEINLVVEYVKIVLSSALRGIYPAVTQEDIGVVTPYKMQVLRIKDRLRRWGLSQITVGTADAFQGQERRVIIVSTVRSQGECYRPTLGFVRDERRFNVLLTRAAAKCIVIGNPYVLQSDEKCWAQLVHEAITENRIINFAGNRRSSYVGVNKPKPKSQHQTKKGKVEQDTSAKRTRSRPKRRHVQ